ncbi:MAG: excinuclease ABC subunit UvrB [Acidobacteria bacterium]|nr:excinuclease ABC subunit UvrB [Acidobacteriota bacterium]MBI3654910.1 excinuclease ABC subunit UvrB [Acidobacteriota bacterium]
MRNFTQEEQRFELSTSFTPRGDQEKAIGELLEGLAQNKTDQVLLGITGSGKTFTMSCVIARANRPALVLAHNKTLAAQLFQEFNNFFPKNAVEYFVSYYDYYQPEAYLPATDTYIEKEVLINDEIDRMRLSATRSLFERRDVIIVASVSCIYGLGSPEAYYSLLLALKQGQEINREEILRKLVEIQYERDDLVLERGKFRVHGDTIEVFPTYENHAVRIELFGDVVDGLQSIDPLRGTVLKVHTRLSIYPRTHFVLPRDQRDRAVAAIEAELASWQVELEREGKPMERARLVQRTRYDLEMLRTVGYCRGIENYSRHLTGRQPGEPPPTLLDYLAPDTLLFVDESHVTLPQVRGMYHGDRTRKSTLVTYGFRMPSALDNRPLNFEEFEKRGGQRIYVSATPGPYELQKAAGRVVEQVIRPTGLMDPEIEVRAIHGQVDNLMEEIRLRAEQNERVLVTTLTKKMAEDLCDYYTELGMRVRYLHADVDTLDRVKILRDLRRGEFDALIGVNLLREGLDLPEVSLVAILDADKEGFLRSASSLIQTSGRAARNSHGKVIMYADQITRSMQSAIAETQRRRRRQQAYNEQHQITPATIIKPIDDTILRLCNADYLDVPIEEEPLGPYASQSELTADIARLEREMQTAAKRFEFERAAALRDQIKQLKDRVLEMKSSDHTG